MLAGGAAVALALALGAEGPKRPTRLQTGFFALLAAAALLPLVPLPDAVADALCGGCRRWDGLPGASAPDGWRPLHLAPGGGAFEVLRFAVLGMFGATSVLRASTERGRARLLPSALAVVTLAVLLAVGSEINGTRLSLLTSQTGASVDGVLAPLLNPNHWAALLTLGLFVAAGLAWERADRPFEAGALALLAAALTTLIVLSWSRGGILAVVPGAVVMAAVWARAAGVSKPVGAVGAALAATGPLLVLGWLAPRSGPAEAGAGGLARELLADVRIPLWRDGLAMVREFPLTGIGRGAVVDVLPQFQTVPSRVRFVWLENTWLQAIVDHGVLLGGAIVVAALLLLGTALRRGVRDASPAASVALLALAVHEVGDFSVQIAVVALTALLLAAYATTPQRLHRVPWSAWLPAGVLLLASASVVIAHADGLREEDLIQQVEEGPTVDQLERVIPILLRERPGSYPIALAVANAYADEGDVGRSLAWANRAQVQAPLHPWPHLHSARLLRRLGATNQAIGEYRLALEDSPPLSGMFPRILDETLESMSQDDLLLRLAPREPPGADARLVWLAWARQDPRALPRARELTRERPRDSWRLLLAVRLAALDGDRDRAIELSEVARELGPLPAYETYYLGRTLRAAGATAEGRAQLEAVLAAGGSHAPAAALDLASVATDEERFGAARALLRLATAGPPHVAAPGYVLQARLDEVAGHPDAAIRACRTALEIQPRHRDATLLLAGLLKRRSNHDAAIELLVEFLEYGEDAEARRELDRLLAAQGS